MSRVVRTDETVPDEVDSTKIVGRQPLKHSRTPVKERNKESFVDESKKNCIIDIGSLTKIIKSHYGEKFNIAEYLDEPVIEGKANKAYTTEPTNVFKSYDNQTNLVGQYLEDTNRFDTDIEDDVCPSPAEYQDISRSVVGDKAARNVFNGVRESYFPLGEYLTLWVPEDEDLQRIFKQRYLLRLKKVTDNEFKFGGKVFKFLLSKDGRMFARTRNELLPINEFIEKYKQYRFDDKKMNETPDIDSLSYSQMMVEHFEQ